MTPIQVLKRWCGPAAVLLLVCFLSPVPRAQQQDIETTDARFRHLSRDYLQRYYEIHPVRATSLGVHTWNDRLPALDHDALTARAAELHAWLERFLSLDPEHLSRDEGFDHEILVHAIRAELLEIEEVARWRQDPTIYQRAIVDGIASLLEREFASLDERLASLVSRLEGIPAVTAAARANLRDVPRLWARLGLNGTEATIVFLRRDVPGALRGQGLGTLPPRSVSRWERARRRALRALERHARWLENDLLPRADGDFRIGRERFERKLLYEEHFDLTVDELRSLNEAAIGEYRDWVAAVAEGVDSGMAPDQVMDRIARDHPRAEDLISTARRFVEQARDFVVSHEILTLPGRELPQIRPTPIYARSGFASMSAPGPFEHAALGSFFNITEADPAWSNDSILQHLSYFNYPGLLGVSVHEVMPGHHVQLARRSELRSDVRKVFAPSSLIEGWAHYAEQMMVDEGLGDGDAVVRLGQLRRALQRHARWYAGLEMHVFGASVADAAERFQWIAYFAPFPSLREAQRGTYDPTYLVYALGRMEILRLREDYRLYLESRGERFSLREFHDRFLELGLPIPLARRALMPGTDELETRSASITLSRLDSP